MPGGSPEFPPPPPRMVADKCIILSYLISTSKPRRILGSYIYIISYIYLLYNASQR